ncbi:MAG: hypothetical protein AAFY88_02465 [Acidobacteriota bacterium]
MVITLLLLLAAPVAETSVTALPPSDLVRGLRAAKIAHTKGDHTREFESLRATRDAYPEDFSTLYAMLSYHRDHGTIDEQLASLKSALSDELTRPENRPSMVTA